MTEQTFTDPLAELADLPVPVLQVLRNLAQDAQVMTPDERNKTYSSCYAVALAAVATGDRPTESVLSNVGALLAAVQDPEGWAARSAASEEG